MNERQLAILIDEIGHLQNELRGCHKDIFALEKENADLRNKLDIAEMVDTDDTRWKLKYEALLTDYGKLEGEVSELCEIEDDLKLLQADYDDLAYAHDELKSDYEALEEDCANLEIGCNNLSFNYNELQYDHEELKDRYQDLEAKFNNMSKMFEAEVKRYDELFDRYSQVVEERNHLDEMLKSAEEDLLATQAKVETYENFEFNKRAVDEAVAQYINDWEKAGY